MSSDPAELLARLRKCLRGDRDAAVAVSGGIDSLTLAHVVHAELVGRAVMYHAVSPAVPAEATARVRSHAADSRWSLRIVDAGEFADPDYLRNPLNRCYFCKSHLYGSIRGNWDGAIFSGTNTDDLSDFRPGLAAAAERQIRHPFVEAGISKAGIRALACHLGLPDIAELPAQPCLASRVATGLPIVAANLRAVEEIESLVRSHVGLVTIRARVVQAAVLEIELEESVLRDLDGDRLQKLRNEASFACEALGFGFSGLRPYRRSGDLISRTARASSMIPSRPDLSGAALD